MNFGLTLKTIRERNKLSQEEVAKRVGKSKSTICKLENNIRTPDIPIIEALAKALGVSVSELYLGDARTLSSHEESVIDAYRRQAPAVQEAIDRMLGLEKKNLDSGTKAV